MPATVIRLEGVCKHHHTDSITTRALDDVSLEIERGEYVTICGPSGCGKSTLLSVLGLLDTPDRGRYVLDGIVTAGLGPDERAAVRNRRIGFVFQSFNLISDLTVRENIELPLTYRELSVRERQHRVETALERVDLVARAEHFPAQLSGGQQQRAAVARAVAGEPAVLLADEPTGNLDSENGGLVLSLLRELHANGTTICMVTHHPAHAAQADRTINMLDGRVLV